MASVDLPLKSPAHSALSEVSDYSTDSDKESNDDSDATTGTVILKSAIRPPSSVIPCNSIPKRDSAEVLGESNRKLKNGIAPRKIILGIKTDEVNCVKYIVGPTEVIHNRTNICNRSGLSDAMLSEGTLASYNIRHIITVVLWFKILVSYSLLGIARLCRL